MADKKADVVSEEVIIKKALTQDFVTIRNSRNHPISVGYGETMQVISPNQSQVLEKSKLPAVLPAGLVLVVRSR